MTQDSEQVFFIEGNSMLFHTIYPVQVAFVVVQNPPNIFEQHISLVYLQARSSVFGAEDDVIENLCVGAHDQNAYKMYVCLSGSFYYLYEPTIMNSLQNFAEILQIDAVILNPIRGSALPVHFDSALRCGAIHFDPHSRISDVPVKYFGQICTKL